MADYEVTITDGVGSKKMKLGNYIVSATSAPGYDTSSLTPTSLSVTNPSQTGAFTLTANGTLTFTETGAAGGTPIISGTVAMTDATGETQYGSAVNIDATGSATFNNVPYGTAQDGYALYLKQLTSDDDHEVYSEVISVNMTGSTQTEYVKNEHKPVDPNITLTDATYTNMPVKNAVLMFQQTPS